MILFRKLTYQIITSFFIFYLISCNSNTTKVKYGIPLQKKDNHLSVKWDNNLSPKIDTWFKKISSGSIFNGNILVAQNGNIIYQNSCGYANYENKDTLTLNHRFQIASVSKTFTAMGIMILKERGLISYDDEVKKYIPGFPYQGVTIKELLSHRSGLPNYNYFCDAYTDRETVIYNKDVVRLMIDSIPAVYYPPNTHFNYCNTNFILLAYIIEKITNTPFEDFLQKEIFSKAGMKNTKLMINGKQNRLYMAATGYHYKWLNAPLTYQDGVVGDKGIYTTVEDLWLWNQALDQHLLVKKETLDEAFEPAHIGTMTNKIYGLGWRLKTSIDGSKFVYHTGWWRGFNSLFLKDLKNNAVYIILSNVRTRAFYTLLPELLGIIDPERRHKQLESDSLYINNPKELTDTVNVEIDL